MGMKVTYSLVFSPDFKEWSRRTFAKGMEKANSAIGVLIYRSFIPKHFTVGGAREYKYQRRFGDYDDSKRKRRGQALPLVGVGNRRKNKKPGELRRQILRVGTVRATPKRMVLKMKAPSYVKLRGKDGTGPDMVEELTTISKREEKQLFEIFEEVISRFLMDEPKKKRTKTK